MRRDSNSYYILQVSDFHISEDSQEDAVAALQSLTDKLKEMDIDMIKMLPA